MTRNKTPPDQWEVLDWLNEFLSGDEAAFDHLVELTANRLFRFCFHLTGNKNSAEELSQEVHLKLYTKVRKCSRFKSEISFYSWLFTIARNVYFNTVRGLAAKAEQKRVRSGSRDGSDTLPDLVERMPDMVVRDQVTLLAIEEALGKLPNEDRMIIVLVDHEEYSYIEAAEIMKMSPAALHSRLLRARKKFFDHYHRDEVGS